jgi:hypothetical protein
MPSIYHVISEKNPFFLPFWLEGPPPQPVRVEVPARYGNRVSGGKGRFSRGLIQNRRRDLRSGLPLEGRQQTRVKMLRSRNPPPWPGVKRFLFPSQRKKRGSFAWLNLEDAGEVLPLSSLWIREFTGYNPCILTGPGQGMGRRVRQATSDARMGLISTPGKSWDVSPIVKRQVWGNFAGSGIPLAWGISRGENPHVQSADQPVICRISTRTREL